MDRRSSTARYAMVTDDRSTLNLDLLTYVGLSDAEQKTVDKIVSDRAAGIVPPPASKPAASAGVATPPPAPAKPAAPATGAAPAAGAAPAVKPPAPPPAAGPTPPAAT